MFPVLNLYGVGSGILKSYGCRIQYLKQLQKGIVVMTSSFTKEAEEFANGLTNQKIRLIDGSHLAELMIEHNLGVSVKAVYETKEIDSDYFNNEG